MSPSDLTYSTITPARNEGLDLPRLAESMVAQSLRPNAWVIVDHGSTDETGLLASRLADEHNWIHVVSMAGELEPTRGGPVVQAFNAGLDALPAWADVIVKVDADVSFEPDHFGRLIAEFERNPSLGMASSTCLEYEGGSWRIKRVGRSHVRGAVRAYRAACLREIMPLEARMGWDTIDEIKAQLRGWTTRSIDDLTFFHHRATGARDGNRRSWESQGALAWYLRYRMPYLFFRTIFRTFDDPRASAMFYSWAQSGLTRQPRCADAEVVRFLRDQQRLTRLPLRAREVRTRRTRSVS
jgi:poly-beta-1,6-N-acetyl-D-glucosamine synthase